TCHGSDGVDPSREEAWVLHAAVLSHIERAVDADCSPDRGVAVLERVEACEPLDAADQRLVRDALMTYLDGDSPERDRVPGWSMLAELSGRQHSSSQ
ncbi:hypothetical protein, partial [Haloplanus sp.]|uniref:DUF7853 family protein n=1 Tax=Haloplanus sp. TaxID=1961696 RepID=UPI002610F9ED